MRNQGVSLVSLIITIIVTIILAAIVIFSGMDTPERAQLATFGNNVTNISAALQDQLTGVSTKHATRNETRNTEQIYFELATGVDCGQFGAMTTTDSGDALFAKSGTPGDANYKVTHYSGENYGNATTDKLCQRIIPAHAAASSKEGGLGYTLPNVRETNEAWYVTQDGQVFNATGFVSGGNTYFNASVYASGELVLTSVNRRDDWDQLAEKIADALVKGQTGEISIAGVTGITVK